MQQTEIYERLTQTLRDVFDDESLVATPELTAHDVKEWDSVNHITLVVAIEEEEETALERAELGGPGGDGRKDVEFVVAESVNCPDADVADYEQGANRKTISAQALLAAAGFVRNGKEDVEEG